MKPNLLKNETNFSQQTKTLLNLIWRYLATNEKATREELCQHFNLSDRTLRDHVATISKVRPIVSISSGKGYRVAKSAADDQAVLTTVLELLSRNAEQLERIRPLVQFLKNKNAEKTAVCAELKQQRKTIEFLTNDLEKGGK